MERKEEGQEEVTYEVDIDDGLERVLGETAYGSQAAIKESWFNKPISDSTGVVEVKEAYKLPAAPITASREHHFEYTDELCNTRDRAKEPYNSSEREEWAGLYLPQMTKSNLPNLSIQAFAAAFRSSGLRTSAWTGRQVRPVSLDSCWAALVFSGPLSTRSKG